MKLELSPQLSTQQNLSLRLQRSSRILQLPTAEIQELLEEALHDNPLLDLDSADLSPDTPPQPSLRWENASVKRRPDAPSDPSGTWRAPASRNEILLENIRLSHADEHCKALCALIIDALDDNGYLQDSYDALLPPGAGQVSEAQWDAALALIQNLSEPGIGARCVEESLMIQLNARQDLSACNREAVEALIQHALTDVSETRLAVLDDTLQQQGSSLAEALSILRQLDPKPGRALFALQPQALIPDVYVIKNAGRWTVIPDRQSLPLVQVDQHYADHLGAHAKECAQALRQVLTDARWLSESLLMRRQTVCRVALHIVQRQQLFFELGEQALQPLKISDLAEELGLHESTISRATTNKYMDTPAGLLSFRYFFSRELDTSFGGTCSSSVVKALIRRLIDEENTDDPLSDVRLHQRLLEESIEISKRTVTKYRLQMRIPNAVERRRNALLKEISNPS